MNRKYRFVLFSFILFIFFPTAILANGWTTLASISTSTFAQIRHTDALNDIFYDGIVSVKGTDRFYTGGTGGYTMYPTYSKLTFIKYPTAISSPQTVVCLIESTGKTDSVVRTNTAHVLDSLSFVKKTEVYAKIGEGYVSNTQIMSTNLEDNK